jgi:anti-sigma factor ChrR (cupin superfamily)
MNILLPAPGDDPTLARIKHNVMQRIAALADRHLTVPAGDDRWQPFLPGVDIKVLHEQDGVMSYLLRLGAGALLPPHRHPIDEECVVLDGEVSIGPLAIGAGGFHLARSGSLHEAITTERGALLYLRGAVPAADQLI